tara:strand:- start:4019 stop:4798 length:780 start_codon:yes stop_codon:yes gene_type:complete
MKKLKKFGQNFLVDENVADRIIAALLPAKGEDILEIGPGPGILTRRLAASGCRLTAIEIDRVLCQRLEKEFTGEENFRLICGDALKYDYALIGSKFKIVSNLPYYAATHILKRLINYGSRVGEMVVMLQKEVADRLTAEPGQREYSSLTIFVQYHCRVERLIEVGKKCFSPSPKIDSSVVRLTPLKQPAVSVNDPKEFFKIVHAAFLHKRKMLKNNLTSWSDYFSEEHGRITLAGIDMNRRGETLSLKDFAKLANCVHS